MSYVVLHSGRGGTARTRQTPFSLFSPVRIALAAFILLALGTPRAQPGFPAPLSYDAGFSPFSVAAADLNGDGIPDLAIANGGGSSSSDQGSVSILLGNGDGTFRAAVNYAADRTPIAVVVGDFNRDGIPDLAVANSSSNNVSVLLGNGAGTFQAAVNYAGGLSPLGLAVGDFNGDGIADLAVPNYLANGTVSILLGNGDGTFQTAQKYAAGSGPSSVAVGDFNRDGILDLAVVLSGFNMPGSSVAILLGKGDGTFSTAKPYTVGSNPFSLAVGDFNRDGMPDLVVTNFGDPSSGTDPSVSVLLGKGDGTFQTPVEYSAGDDPVTVQWPRFLGGLQSRWPMAGLGSPGLHGQALGRGDPRMETHLPGSHGPGPQPGVQLGRPAPGFRKPGSDRKGLGFVAVETQWRCSAPQPWFHVPLWLSPSFARMCSARQCRRQMIYPCLPGTRIWMRRAAISASSPLRTK
jgi:hypothetical protein